MSQRPNVTTGFLFDKKWEPTMRKLKPKDFHLLFWELYDFQMSGGKTQVPAHEEHLLLAALVSFILPQLENRLAASGFFPPTTHSGETEEASASPMTSPVSTPTGGAAGGVTGGAAPPATPKLSQDKIRQDKHKSTLRQVECKTDRPVGTAVEGCPPGAVHPAPRETESDQKSSQKRGYGSLGNVMMTPEGYQFITESLGIPEAFINHFSEKLASRGYQYPDHVAALTAWWHDEKNKLYYKNASAKTPPETADEATESQEQEGSFDTDDFFTLAVMKSLGEAP